jgi:hypothetical protein
LIYNGTARNCGAPTSLEIDDVDVLIDSDDDDIVSDELDDENDDDVLFVWLDVELELDWLLDD